MIEHARNINKMAKIKSERLENFRPGRFAAIQISISGINGNNKILSDTVGHHKD
jgi:hypothetical protein